MTYTVTITSQGQISIPAPIRRKLGLDKLKKAVVTEKNGGFLIEPIQDLLDLKGSLKTDVNISSSEIRQGFKEYLAQRHSSK